MGSWYPTLTTSTKTSLGWGTLGRWRADSLRAGWDGFVVSHPNDKNKDVVRMGHPFVLGLELRKTTARTTADPSTPLRSLRKILCWGGSCYPRSQNRDLGHPLFCRGEERHRQEQLQIV